MRFSKSMNRFILIEIIFAKICCLSGVAFAQEALDKAQESDEQSIDTIYIFESEDETLSPGVANKLSSQEIKKFRHTNVEDAISVVPGVYVQTEDGYGLRPNIGLRGVNPHRSKKVCLMEDDILLIPAPYSAPAAYFFPSMEMIESIEVVKGPSAIIHGPNTIGGSVKIKSLQIPDGQKSKVNLGYGSFQERKLTLATGDSNEDWGWLFAYSNAASDGFRKLPQGKESGYNRDDFLGKVRKNIISGNDLHQIEFKYKLGVERSHETYLGLSETDFAKDPFQRYAASQNDLMKWRQQQFVLQHNFESATNFKIKNAVYYNQFNRAWNKFEGFSDSDVNIRDLLFDENSSPSEYLDRLRGTENTDPVNPATQIKMTNADREYYSKGVFTQLSLPITALHSLNLGMRFHQDGVERLHTNSFHNMVNGEMQLDVEASGGVGRFDEDSSEAFAASVQYDATVGDWRIVPGLRYEHIRNLREDKKNVNASDIKLTEVLVSPGVGVNYNGIDKWNLFTGAYKGFSPTGPGQSGDIKPEESNNYELGASYGDKDLNSTLVAFYNDYENIKGICSMSVGCDPADLDKESNGGKAKIYGTEFNISMQTQFSNYTLQSEFSHTYTYAGFLNDIISNDVEWGEGEIKSGDPLPYVPDQKSTLGVGIKKKNWGLRTKVHHTGRRFDQSLELGRRTLSSYITIDLAGDYTVYDNINLFAKVDNLTNKEYVSTMRPNGLRPGKPRSFFVGTQVEF